jgi:hypothetical protein
VDPLSAVGSFASLFGLIFNFRSEMQANEKADYDEFILWLGRKNHKELIQEITSNHVLGLSIKSLLSENHDVVMKKLSAIETAMAAVSEHIGGLKEISKAIHVNDGLSDQAFSILKQLDNSGGSFFIELIMPGGTHYKVMDANCDIEINEPRFINDDLDKLCNLGLLILEFNSKGSRLFRITRAASKLVKASEL